MPVELKESYRRSTHVTICLRNIDRGKSSRSDDILDEGLGSTFRQHYWDVVDAIIWCGIRQVVRIFAMR